MISKPLLLFAPGAGAPSSHPWMRAWAERLTAIGNVRTFDYDYLREGRRRPDPPAILIAAHRDRKSTRLNSSHSQISYAVFCLKKKNNITPLSPAMLNYLARRGALQALLSPRVPVTTLKTPSLLA